MLQEQRFPTVKHTGGNLYLLAQFRNGFVAGEVSPQHTEDKRQAVLAIRNQKIRENGVRMTAGRADEALYHNAVVHNGPIYNVNDCPFVRCEGIKCPSGMAKRTRLLERTEFSNKIRIERVRRFFYLKKLAKQSRTAYHRNQKYCGSSELFEKEIPDPGVWR